MRCTKFRWDNSFTFSLCDIVLTFNFLVNLHICVAFLHLPLVQSGNIMDFNHVKLCSNFPPLSCHQYNAHYVFERQPLLSTTSISPVEKCDFLNLTFFRQCCTVMRYSIETSNRLMVHLAGLINSYVEAEKASRKLFPIAETPDNLWSIDHFTAWCTSHAGSFIDTLHMALGWT